MVTLKTKQLLKSLAKAGQQMQQTQSKHESVVAQLEKVKELSQQKAVPKRQLSEELEVLSQMLGGISDMQGQLLRKEDEQAAEVKRELRELKLKLSLVQSGDLSRKLDRIGFLITELTTRVNNYVDIKTDRERRVEELERKIKEQVSVNYRELQKLEQSVEALQEKYNELRESGKYSREHLSAVEKKLDELRLSVLKKKEQIIARRQEELMLPRVESVQKKLLPAPKPRMPSSAQSKLPGQDQPFSSKLSSSRPEPVQGVSKSMPDLGDDDLLSLFPEEAAGNGGSVSGQHDFMFPKAGQGMEQPPSFEAEELSKKDIPPPPFEDFMPIEPLQDLPPPPSKRRRGGLLGFVHRMFGRKEESLY